MHPTPPGPSDCTRRFSDRYGRAWEPSLASLPFVAAHLPQRPASTAWAGAAATASRPPRAATARTTASRSREVKRMPPSSREDEDPTSSITANCAGLLPVDVVDRLPPCDDGTGRDALLLDALPERRIARHLAEE